MTAAERWIDEQTGSVDHDGDTVHAAVTVDLNVDSIVTVRRIHAQANGPRGSRSMPTSRSWWVM